MKWRYHALLTLLVATNLAAGLALVPGWGHYFNLVAAGFIAGLWLGTLLTLEAMRRARGISGRD